MSSAQMETSNRPAGRTGFHYEETSALADSCRGNKVHFEPVTRAARNEWATGHPSNLLARRSSPDRPRAGLTAHHPESHRGLLRLTQARNPELCLSQNREHQFRSISPSPTTRVFSVRSRDGRLDARWRGYR